LKGSAKQASQAGLVGGGRFAEEAAEESREAC